MKSSKNMRFKQFEPRGLDKEANEGLAISNDF